MNRAIVVIGPSGNGKSTLGRMLAERLGRPFIEGDDHHPPANIAKMARGEPLTDKDRVPFLNSIGRTLAAHPQGAVAACSALKRTYRDTLRAHVKDMTFVLAELSREELLRRMSARHGHFMPPSLLESQLADFEPPAGDEHAILIDGESPPSMQVESILDQLRAQER